MMFGLRNTPISYDSIRECASGKKVILFSPWSNYRSTFLSTFFANGEHGMLYYSQSDRVDSLDGWTRDLVREVRLAVPNFGSNTLKQLGSAGPVKLGRALAEDLNEASPDATILFIDEFDASAFSNDMELFFAALVGGLSDNVKIAVSSRLVPYRPWDGLLAQGDAVVLNTQQRRDQLTFTIEDRPKPQLEVFAFGRGTAYVNGTEITQWDGMLPRGLFFYLIDNPLVTRDEIFQDFWPQPQVAIKDATDIFHVTKHKVAEVINRKLSGSKQFDLTSYRQGFYIPNDAISRHYDVASFCDAFERARQSGSVHEQERELRRAIDFYKGPFLTSMDSEWVLRRRECLEFEYSEALIRLGRIKADAGQAAEGSELLAKATQRRPEREDVRRRLIELYFEQDRSDDARTAFKGLVDEIYAPLGMNLPPESRELGERIGAL